MITKIHVNGDSIIRLINESDVEVNHWSSKSSLLCLSNKKIQISDSLNTSTLEFSIDDITSVLILGEERILDVTESYDLLNILIDENLLD